MRASISLAYRLCCYTVLIAGSWAFSRQERIHSQAITLASEGSLDSMQVASSMAQKPGEMAAFYNPNRRVGRDCSVLSLAQWMIDKQQNSKSGRQRPIQILDAHAASGMAGLRVAVESPILARSYLGVTDESTTDSPPPLPPLTMTLNDFDPEAVRIATHNAELASQLIQQPVSVPSSLSTISVSNRNSQSLWHESSFDVSLIDPFGCATACLDSTLARAPQGGVLDICATDVTALYGGRPAMAARHYGGCYLTNRPPCFKERGVRMLLAAVAQAAGRQDRGIRPLYSLSTAHYVVVAVQVVRRGKTFGADAAIDQVQCFPICRSCGAPGGIENMGDKESTKIIAPDCLCDASEPGAGTSAICEGPLWRGPLHDSAHLEGMMRLACLPEAQGWISPETKDRLQTMCDESLVEAVDCISSRSIFHRRPSLAAPGCMPPLEAITEELQRRGFQACRTQFDKQALKSNASPPEFDDCVRSLDHGLKI